MGTPTTALPTKAPSSSASALPYHGGDTSPLTPFSNVQRPSGWAPPDVTRSELGVSGLSPLSSHHGLHGYSPTQGKKQVCRG